ncbi:MAG: Rpn family recombination-promoting nuclease/putative transposase, partial [Synergistaceae bacterium]|nr:Rpn family recombination-promoting nuclease/putative transposase [Synergistaceae bacterium]
MEAINSVFADIVNVFFAVNGIDAEVDPNDLDDAKARTNYKPSNENKLREQERDVVKFWKRPDGEAVICLVGLENQTSVDNYMPLRVIGYEGADYRGQLKSKTKAKAQQEKVEPHFIITIVLYFGVNRRWPKKRSLHDMLNVPEQYRKVVNDCRVNVLELAWLSDEQEKLFKSDFFYIVHYLRQARKKEKLDVIPEEKLKYVSETATLLKALSRDDEYDVVIEELNKFDAKNRKGEKGMKLPSLFDAARAEGEAR